MTYGRWTALDEADPPEGPGLLQVRLAQGLIEYPSGKSAMVYYGADDAQIADELERVRAHLADHDGLWVRFAAATAAKAELEKELAGFRERFGSPPRDNK